MKELDSNGVGSTCGKLGDSRSHLAGACSWRSLGCAKACRAGCWGAKAASSRRFDGLIFSAGLLIWRERWVRIGERSRRKALSDWRMTMQWTAPVFVEVCLNCEINSYVSAKL